MLPDHLRLTGQVALVTGAGAPDGIGMATARLLGALGAQVAVAATTDRVHERAGELEAAGTRAIGVTADLTQEEQVLDVVARVGRHPRSADDPGQQRRDDEHELPGVGGGCP